MFLVNVPKWRRQVLQYTLVISAWEDTVRIAATLARQAHRWVHAKCLDHLLVVVLFRIGDIVHASVRVDVPVAGLELRLRLHVVELVIKIAETNLVLLKLEPRLNDNPIVWLLPLWSFLCLGWYVNPILIKMVFILSTSPTRNRWRVWCSGLVCPGLLFRVCRRGQHGGSMAFGNLLHQWFVASTLLAPFWLRNPAFLRRLIIFRRWHFGHGFLFVKKVIKFIQLIFAVLLLSVKRGQN